MSRSATPDSTTTSEQIATLRLHRLAGTAPEHIGITGRTTLIGEGDECPHKIEDPAVSRRHALVEHLGGTWFVSDLDSRNGTFVNGERLLPHQRMPLEHGDSLRLASVLFRINLRARRATDLPALDDTATGRIEHASQAPSGQFQTLLSGLIAASASIHSAGDEESLWNNLLRSALSLTAFERGAVLRPVETRSPGELRTADIIEICAAIDQRSAQEPFTFSRTLVRAASDGPAPRPVFLRSEQAPPEVESVGRLNITTAACIPLTLDGAVWGVLYLDSRRPESGITDGLPNRDSIEDVCRALAQMGSLALSSLLRRDVQKRLSILERDAETASQAQRLLLPGERGRIGQLEYALRFRPGRAISGDLVGIAQLDERRSAAFVGDVTGKGIGAGLVMATIQAYLSSSLLRHGSAIAAIEDLNRHLADRLPPGRFASLWLGLFEADENGGGMLTSVDAGHGNALLVKPERVIELQSEGGPWLGAFPDTHYRSTQLRLKPGQRVVIVSDGLIEQPGPDGEAFGMERAQAAMSSTSSASEDVAQLLAAVEEFAGTPGFRDDLTVLSLELPPSTGNAP